MSKKQNLVEKLLQSFSEKTELVLTEVEQKKHNRLMFVLETKLLDISITDADLYKKVLEKFGKDYTIGYFQVCQDISVIERAIAHEINPTGDAHKTWIRYMVTEMAKAAYNLAKKNGEPYNMTYAATTIGRHHLTDKEDVIKPPFDDIIPFVPEITNDVSVLGIKPMGRMERKEIRAKLLIKYGVPELIEIEDAKEIDDGEAEK